MKPKVQYVHNKDTVPLLTQPMPGYLRLHLLIPWTIGETGRSCMG